MKGKGTSERMNKRKLLYFPHRFCCQTKIWQLQKVQWENSNTAPPTHQCQPSNMSADIQSKRTAPRRTSTAPLSILVLLLIEKVVGGGEDVSKRAASKWLHTVLTVQCSAGGWGVVGSTTWAQTAGTAADCLRLLRTGGLHNRRR